MHGLTMDGTGDFFPESGIGIGSERIDVATPSSRIFADDTPATTKVQNGLRQSRGGYQGFFKKLYGEFWRLTLIMKLLKLKREKVFSAPSFKTLKKSFKTLKKSSVDGPNEVIPHGSGRNSSSRICIWHIFTWQSVEFVQLLQQLMQSQQQAFQSMATTIRQGFFLPKPDLSLFDSNPLEFWSSMRSFENNIEKNTSDENARLTFLLQYGIGHANAIKSCVTMDPASGCQTARKVLKERFGHPFKIATSHVNQATRGPPVKPSDRKGLQTFADQLKDCLTVLESIGCLDEINSADSLRKIIDRLPFPGCIIFQVLFQKEPELLTVQSSGVLYSEEDKGKNDTSDRKPRPPDTMTTSHLTYANFGRPNSIVPCGRKIWNR